MLSPDSLKTRRSTLFNNLYNSVIAGFFILVLLKWETVGREIALNLTGSIYVSSGLMPGMACVRKRFLAHT